MTPKQEREAQELSRYETALRPHTWVVALDDWYPCFPGNLVRVSWYQDPGSARVAVWGADDTGLEIQVPVMEDALRLVRNLPIVISMDYLRSIGFSAA